jgi:hypothetical protein
MTEPLVESLIPSGVRVPAKARTPFVWGHPVAPLLFDRSHSTSEDKRQNLRVAMVIGWGKPLSSRSLLQSHIGLTP